MLLELGSVPADETNLFAIIREVEAAHMRAMKSYPYMEQFLNRSKAEDVSEALLAVEDKRNLLMDFYDKVYARADYSGLPAGVDGSRLHTMMDLTIKGLMTERFLDASFQPEMLYREICEYLDMMQKLVYRE
jgi:hypothetical protein